MPYPDTLATYTYYLTQIRAMNPAYVQLARYIPAYDVPTAESTPDKLIKRGCPHDVLTVYGPIIKPPPSVLSDHTVDSFLGPALPTTDFAKSNPTPTRLLLNAGLQPEEAEQLIAEEKIDAAVFGYLWMGNPDLQARLEHGVELNMEVDLKTLYGKEDGEDLAVGYNDYSFAVNKM